MTMTMHQYRRALVHLGLTQGEAAKRFGYSIRSSNGYANGVPIPASVGMLIEAAVRESGVQALSDAPKAVVKLSKRPIAVPRGRPFTPGTPAAKRARKKSPAVSVFVAHNEADHIDIAKLSELLANGIELTDGALAAKRQDVTTRKNKRTRK